MPVNVDVFPQDAEIFFVHANGVLDRTYVAFGICERNIEIHNLAKAIAPESKGIRIVPQTVFTGIKCVLSISTLAWIAIRDH